MNLLINSNLNLIHFLHNICLQYLYEFILKNIFDTQNAFRFPSDPEERNKWLEIVKLNRPFFEKAKICSHHFKPADYMITGKRLRQGVTPFFHEVSTRLFSIRAVLHVHKVSGK